MATKVLMPKLGAQMEEGTIVSWLVEVGEEVEDGDPLVEIQTDKITMEIEAESDGVLLKTLYDAEDVVPVQKPIAFIGEEGENIDELEQESSVNEKKAESREQEPYEQERETHTESEDRIIEKIRRTPAARKLAEERYIDLRNIEGSGPLGRVHKKDVDAYAEDSTQRTTPLAKKIADNNGIDLNKVQGSGDRRKIYKRDLYPSQGEKGVQESTEDKRVPFKGMRKVIAKRISESAYTSPHVTLTAEIDMTNMVDLRKQLLPVIEETEGLRISFNDLLLKVTAFVLKQNPDINIQLDGEEIIYHSAVNLGVAVAVEEGLVVPVLRDVDKKGLTSITKETKDLGKKAKDGALSHDDFAGSTFTVSNLGMYSVDGFTPIINSPNAAILGVGRIQKKPAVVDDELSIRSMMNLSLSFDHRIIDGAPAAAFLTDLQKVLENPYKLMV